MPPKTGTNSRKPEIYGIFACRLLSVLEYKLKKSTGKMIQELFSWLDAQRITYIPVDTEVVDIPGFGRLFTADLSGVESIFRGDGDKLVFNLMESPDVLMEEGSSCGLPVRQELVLL